MDYKPVHFHIYDPSNSIFKGSKNDRSKMFLIMCRNSNDCDLFKVGMCSLRAAFGWNKCPYGINRNEEGFTKRARKFYEWIRNKKEIYKDIGTLSEHTKGIYFIGDYVFLPYPFIANNEKIPFLSKGGAFLKECSFLERDKFNINTINKIIEFKPQAMMGGEIKDYQEKSVPLFLVHLKEKCPDLFGELRKGNKLVDEIIKLFSNIGRRAYVKTLKVGCEISKNKSTWVWDGVKLISETYKPIFSIVDTKSFKSELVPTDDAVIKIQSDDQVCSETKFLE